MANGRMLGVLGGMGPLASADFMARLTLLTPAAREQDHIPAVLWSDPRVPDRTAEPALMTGDADPLPWLLGGIAGLIAAGCGAIVVPCNTAHLWYDRMRDAADCPMPHIVDAAATALRTAGVAEGPVGLLATAATIRSGLYQTRLAVLGYTTGTLDADAMARLVTPSIALIKAGRIAQATPALVEAAEMLVSGGARAVVLGCTEIPLGLRGADVGAPMIDTVDALAQAAIAWFQSGD